MHSQIPENSGVDSVLLYYLLEMAVAIVSLSGGSQLAGDALMNLKTEHCGIAESTQNHQTQQNPLTDH
jgi:hypothetical protein